MLSYRTCKRCVMSDKSDDTIFFDENGNCNYCTEKLSVMPKVYFPNKEGEKKLAALIASLKEKNKTKQYDCLMGISGGLDSCYLAYLGAVKWGLRILAVHIDDGFDTEIAKENIKKLCDKCNIELNMIYPDKEQFSALSKAYLRAGVPNLAVPQDNVLFACIYNFAKENNVNDFLSGANFALESILQQGNTYTPYDLVNIRDINKKFGTMGIEKLPLLSNTKMIMEERMLKVIKYTPLDYIDYDRERALQELYDFCKFEYYGAKHLENYFTGFLQLYWLPIKFGVDKRTSHLSSMIISNQITREEALKKLEEPLYTQEWLDKVINLLKSELNISDEEFEKIIADKTHQHNEYKVDKLFNLLLNVRLWFVKKKKS